MKNLLNSFVVISVLFVVAVVVGGLSMMRLTAGKGDIQRLAFGTPSPETAGTESASGPAVPVPTVEVKPVLEAPNVVSNVYIEYILDGSGSMMGRLPDGTAKEDVAKEVLLKHIESFPAGTHIGLRVFGNEVDWKGHEKESCRDIKSIAPVETGQVEKIVTWLGKGYHPRGMTPLAGSVMEAIKDFKASSGRVNSIIVISDGKETCGGDPCKLVGVMKEKRIHFSLHVVGLNVDKKTRQELQCMAKAGGGVYREAKNAQEVNEALKEIEKEEIQKVEKQARGAKPSVPSPTKKVQKSLVSPPPPMPKPTAKALPSWTPTLVATDTPVPTNTPAPTRVPEAVVQAKTANVRSGPGLMYPIVAQVEQGDVLTIVGRNPEGTWWEVRLNDGTVGWIYSGLVKTSVPVEKVPVEKDILTPPPTPTPILLPTPSVTPTSISSFNGGGHIVFVSGRSASHAPRLYIMRPDGSEVRPLPHNPMSSQDSYPSFSPDGREVAFLSYRTTPSIYVMRIDGGSEKKITADKCGYGSRISWSPDGTKIAFANCGEVHQVFVVSLSGGSARQLTNVTEGAASDPTWSPDGNFIAFSVHYFDGSSPEIFILNVSDGSTRPFVKGFNPAWSPDGKHLAFVRKLSPGRYQVMSVSLDRSDFRALSPVGNDDCPAWSPDGAHVAFSHDQNIYVVDADGGYLRKLTNDGVSLCPAWGR